MTIEYNLIYVFLLGLGVAVVLLLLAPLIATLFEKYADWLYNKLNHF